MKEYPNFYENIIEAGARLLGTVVLYEGLPYHIFAITDHIGDGIFRVYLFPVGLKTTEGIQKALSIASNMGHNHPYMGRELDKVLDDHPDCGVKRKYMNSSKFNKFRPFPLGMCNVKTQVYYMERQPIRPMMHQGLAKGAVFETLVTTGSRKDNPRRPSSSIDMNSSEFRDCVLGDHYNPHAALNYLKDPAVLNDALAFHREFAFCRGPLNAIYLAYKSDIIGLVPNRSSDCVVLGEEFHYCKEVVDELNLFDRVY